MDRKTAFEGRADMLVSPYAAISGSEIGLGREGIECMGSECCRVSGFHEKE
jgi:hypothetical protein